MRKSGPMMTPRGQAEAVQPMAFMHPCWKEGCDADAPFGFGVALLRRKPGRWSCAEHRNELLEVLAHPAMEAGEAPHVENGTGDLSSDSE